MELVHGNAEKIPLHEQDAISFFISMNIFLYKYSVFSYNKAKLNNDSSSGQGEIPDRRC
jgi:hypothetical protein